MSVFDNFTLGQSVNGPDQSNDGSFGPGSATTRSIGCGNSTVTSDIGVTTNGIWTTNPNGSINPFLPIFLEYSYPVSPPINIKNDLVTITYSGTPLVVL